MMHRSTDARTRGGSAGSELLGSQVWRSSSWSLPPNPRRTRTRRSNGRIRINRHHAPMKSGRARVSQASSVGPGAAHLGRGCHRRLPGRRQGARSVALAAAVPLAGHAARAPETEKEILWPVLSGTPSCEVGELTDEHERIVSLSKRGNRRRAWGWGMTQILLSPSHLGLVVEHHRGCLSRRGLSSLAMPIPGVPSGGSSASPPRRRSGAPRSDGRSGPGSSGARRQRVWSATS